jgi:hypothetical protein
MCRSSRRDGSIPSAKLSGPIALRLLRGTGTGARALSLGYGMERRRVMHQTTGSRQIDSWPEQSREAAKLVIDKYGEPDEVTESELIWHRRGEWKRIVASRAFYRHEFPAPHEDSVESFIDYRVPPEKASELASFDGSVIVERTAGEVSARCHDEEANRLALNLMHDIVTGAKTVEEARAYYAKEFADYRRKKPTPYMEALRFTPGGETADPDRRVLSDQDLKAAESEGRQRATEAAH